MSIIVSDIRYEIVIVAVKGEKRNFVVELKQSGLKDLHFSVGRNASLPNLIGRIVGKLEAGEIITVV